MPRPSMYQMGMADWHYRTAGGSTANSESGIPNRLNNQHDVRWCESVRPFKEA